MLTNVVKKLSSGDVAPAFSTLSDQEESITLKQFLGKTVILYFYPKDDTPGCTTEACDFAAQHEVLTDKDVVVIGISKDSTQSHRAFKAKYKLPFILLSDHNGSICEAYGAWGTKVNYGKTYEGIIRSTFLIDPSGKIRQAWYNVKAAGHVAKVLQSMLG